LVQTFESREKAFLMLEPDPIAKGMRSNCEEFRGGILNATAVILAAVASITFVTCIVIRLSELFSMQPPLPGIIAFFIFAVLVACVVFTKPKCSHRRRFLKDFASIWVLSFLFLSLKNLPLYCDLCTPIKFGHLLLAGAGFSLFDASVVCYPIFAVTIRWLNSPLLFFVLSCFAAALIVVIDIANAAASVTSSAAFSGLTAKAGGYYIYESGHITPYGVVVEMMNPALIMALYASRLVYLKYLAAFSERFGS
jgi:hypothetical protein